MARTPKTSSSQPILPYDPSVPTTQRDIKKAEEHWSSYTLDDGSILKIRPVLVDVVRARNKFADDGTPMYFLKSALIINVKAPAKLRKKAPAKKKTGQQRGRS